MTIPVQSIVERVIDLLIDYDRGDDARWSDDELIRWINDSRMAIITRRPQAGPPQPAPEDAVTFLDAIRNMGTDGATPGRAIRRIDRQNLDDDDLYWHKAPKKAEISQFTFDDRVPRRFYVYPPALAGTQIEVSYAKNPAAVASLGDSLDFQPEYIDAVVNYVAYRAKSKDSQYSNAAEAAAFYGAFNDALGIQSQTQAAASPNQPGNSV